MVKTSRLALNILQQVAAIFAAGAISSAGAATGPVSGSTPGAATTGQFSSVADTPAPTPGPAKPTPSPFDPNQFAPLTSSTLPLENGKRIVMRVNDVPLSWEDFTTQLRMAAAEQYQQQPGKEAQIASALSEIVKEGLITTGLYREFANRHHLMPESREIEGAKAKAFSNLSLRIFPGIRLLSPDQLTQLMTDNLAQVKVNKYLGDLATSVPATQQELAEFVEKNKPTTSPATILRARHIVIRATAQMSQFQKNDARARAEEILGRIKGAPETSSSLKGADKVPFPTAARQFSQDRQTAFLGGDLGYFPLGKMYPEVNEALEKLKPGEISPVVESPVGFHIFQLTEREEGDDLRLIYDIWRTSEAIGKWKTSSQKNAKIENYLESGEPGPHAENGAPPQ